MKFELFFTLKLYLYQQYNVLIQIKFFLYKLSNMMNGSICIYIDVLEPPGNNFEIDFCNLPFALKKKISFNFTYFYESGTRVSSVGIPKL